MGLRKAAFFLSFAALGLGTAASAWAQSVISAHSGVIQYTEGQVTLDGQTVQMKTSQFPDVKTGQTLAAEDGRAEILLTPGVFLRIAENSSFKMVSNKLSDTRIEMLTGSAVFEVGELLQDNAITVVYKGTEIALAKKGLYRIDSDPARLRVYDGEAKLTASGKDVVAHKGHEVALGAELEAKNFDTKQTDEFYRWSERRDEYVAEANVSAAKYARDSGLGYNGSANSAFGSGVGYSGLGYGSGLGSWAYNPWFGMFTYLPYNGMFYSPYGYGYFSPGMVGSLYMPGSPYYYGGGYSPITTGAVSRNGASSIVTSRTPGVSTVNPGGVYRRGGSASTFGRNPIGFGNPGMSGASVGGGGMRGGSAGGGMRGGSMGGGGSVGGGAAHAGGGGGARH